MRLTIRSEIPYISTCKYSNTKSIHREIKQRVAVKDTELTAAL